MIHEKTEKVEVYYKRIQKLVHGLIVPTTYNFLTIVLARAYNHMLELRL
jgi:hypothetical protein